MTKRRFAATVLVALSALTQGPATAHTGWKVEGKLVEAVNMGACLYAVSCMATYGTSMGAMHQDPSLPICQDDSPLNDVDMSIRKLPAGVGGHKAQVTYTALVDPVNPVVVPPVVTVHFFRPGEPRTGFDLRGPCGHEMPNNRQNLSASGAKITIGAGATHLGISARGAAGLEWTVSGVVH